MPGRPKITRMLEEIKWSKLYRIKNKSDRSRNACKKTLKKLQKELARLKKGLKEE